ncbi:MAG: lipopolysaccharide kinase InaA family protein [Deltaproteobacteria bacterium]|nr:lipopolysaccharide kinase InaA family protein [Deltaproteobacteria bacterium]
MLELLADADRLLEGSNCHVIKDQRKIKVGRVPIDWGERKAVVYIKRYNAFSFRYRLQSIISCSGAERSLRGAAILSAIGVNTARPVAVIEHRIGCMLVKSFYMSDEIRDGKTADAFWRENLKKVKGALGLRCRRLFLKQLAELFSRLHAHNVYHNDLKDANIIVAPNAEELPDSLYLLDLEGVKRYGRLSRSRQIKNLVQLNRTFGRYLRRSELLYFLSCYLAPNIVERQAAREWAGDIVKRSIRLDRIKKSDHGR